MTLRKMSRVRTSSKLSYLVKLKDQLKTFLNEVIMNQNTIPAMEVLNPYLTRALVLTQVTKAIQTENIRGICRTN